MPIRSTTCDPSRAVVFPASCRNALLGTAAADSASLFRQPRTRTAGGVLARANDAGGVSAAGEFFEGATGGDRVAGPGMRSPHVVLRGPGHRPLAGAVCGGGGAGAGPKGYAVVAGEFCGAAGERTAAAHPRQAERLGCGGDRKSTR